MEEAWHLEVEHGKHLKRLNDVALGNETWKTDAEAKHY